MLKNHLLVGLRTLRKHRSYTVLTVLGLALGLAVCLLILTFVWEQQRYDEFHPHADRVVRVLSDRIEGDTDDVEVTLAATPAPLADALGREVPGIEAAVRLGQIRSRVLRGSETVDLTGLYAEPTFFDLFDFEAASGDARDVLAQPYHLLLSPQAATNLFGTADPAGKTITLEGHGDFIVGGILAEPPGPSHLRFDVLAAFSTLAASDRRDELADWNNSWRFATYLLLDDQSITGRLEAALPAIAERAYAGQEERLAFRVQPLGDIALGPVLGNEISSYSIPAVMVYFLSVLGLIVMLAAGFNYVGLSTARAVRRAEEVGTRKALGAGRWQIVTQFLSEAVLVALGALVVAYGLLLWLVPAFNGLTFVQMLDARIGIDRLLDLRLLGLFVGFSVVAGLVAGLFPALRLARFAPLAAMRGDGVRGFSGRWLRHGLIGTQFVLALFFVATTALLLAQARHLLHADYGFRQDDLITVPLQGQDYEVLRGELLRYPEVAQIAATSKLPASGSVARVELRQTEDDEPIAAFEYAVDADFLDVLDLNLIAGRTFSSARASDSTESVVLNETAVRTLSLGTPASAVGAELTVGDPGRAVEVIGVVQDYHYNTLMDPIESLVLTNAPSDFQYMLVRTETGQRTAAAERLEAVWAQLTPEHPVDYAFLDAELGGPLNEFFSAFTRLIGTIAGLAVAISLLGLLGMAAYHVETHVKEVGVRKVLGARRRDIVLLLSRGFVRVVLVGTMIASPLAWLAGHGWLQIFAVRVEPSLWLLVGCALGMVLLALGVITSQTLRAATCDPVETLRYE